jgi:hypothetical protein
MPKASAARRARSRKAWPVVAYALGHEPPDDLSSTTTLEERLAMMRPLALAAWSVAGREVPGYGRDEMPARLIAGPPRAVRAGRTRASQAKG